MSENQKAMTFKPLCVSLHEGEYSTYITRTNEYSPIKVTAEARSFTTPFSRVTENFQTDDTQGLIDRMKVLDLNFFN